MALSVGSLRGRNAVLHLLPDSISGPPRRKLSLAPMRVAPTSSLRRHESTVIAFPDAPIPSDWLERAVWFNASTPKPAMLSAGAICREAPSHRPNVITGGHQP